MVEERCIMREPTILLSRADVESCISLAEIVEVVQKVFQAHAENKIVLPPKLEFNLAPMGIKAWNVAMPAYIATYNAAGIKWVGGFAGNPRSHDLPYTMATILLQDPETGVLLGVMDGSFITGARTGAAAAVAAHLCALPEATKVSMVGTGVQARYGLEALMHLRKLTEVRAVAAHFGSAERFASDMGKRFGLSVTAHASVQEALDGTEIIIAATTAPEPIIRDEWLMPGVTAVAVGAYPEYDDKFVLSANRILVDDLGQCLKRGGLVPLFRSGRLTEGDIDANLGEIISGLKPARVNSADRVLAVPVGLGTHDVAIASIVHKRATERGLGGRFDFL